MSRPVKIVSWADEVLGVAWLPPEWLAFVKLHGVKHFAPVPNVVAFPSAADTATTIRVGTLLAGESDDPDALVLDGCDLEEFEKLPGVMFAAGAKALRK